MKKKIFLFLSIFIVLISLTGCSIGNTPTMSVEKLFKKYNNQDDEIVLELDDYLNGADLTNEQTKRYKEVYLKQFKNLKYEVKSETIDGDEAKVVCQITVYDYYSADKEASKYLIDHSSEFNVNGSYSPSLFNDYKLNLYEKVDTTVDYTLEFNLTKIDDEWVINELTNEQLEKIHGIYAY